jgi:hypothetical protein
MLCASFHKIAPPQPGRPGLLLEFALRNDASRVATVLAYDFELWVRGDANRTSAVFLSKLFVDQIMDVSKFEPGTEKHLALTWQYAAKQLQEVESCRKGSGPIFEIRGEVCVAATWPGHVEEMTVSSFAWEKVFNQAGSQRTFPIRLAYPLEDWVAPLGIIGFRNLLLHEFPLPAFPPTFSRAGRFLAQAWDDHRAARSDEALLACRKSLECLGFDVYGQTNVARRDIVERMMPTAPPAKHDVVEKYWVALQNVLNEGIHEHGEPVHFDQADTEMVLVSVAALLSYFAKLTQS